MIKIGIIYFIFSITLASVPVDSVPEEIITLTTTEPSTTTTPIVVPGQDGQDPVGGAGGGAANVFTGAESFKCTPKRLLAAAPMEVTPVTTVTPSTTVTTGTTVAPVTTVTPGTTVTPVQDISQREAFAEKVKANLGLEGCLSYIFTMDALDGTVDGCKGQEFVITADGKCTQANLNILVQQYQTLCSNEFSFPDFLVFAMESAIAQNSTCSDTVHKKFENTFLKGRPACNASKRLLEETPTDPPTTTNLPTPTNPPSILPPVDNVNTGHSEDAKATAIIAQAKLLFSTTPTAVGENKFMHHSDMKEVKYYAALLGYDGLRHSLLKNVDDNKEQDITTAFGSYYETIANKYLNPKVDSVSVTLLHKHDMDTCNAYFNKDFLTSAGIDTKSHCSMPKTRLLEEQTPPATTTPAGNDDQPPSGNPVNVCGIPETVNCNASLASENKAGLAYKTILAFAADEKLWFTNFRQAWNHITKNNPTVPEQKICDNIISSLSTTGLNDEVAFLGNSMNYNPLFSLLYMLLTV